MEFKTIERYTNYEVSETGVVRNKKTGNTLKPTINAWGVPIIALFSDGDQGKNTTSSVARLVAETWLGMPLGINARVGHKNGNKGDVRAENLFFSTKTAQMLDQFRSGRIPAGKPGEVVEVYSENGVLLCYAVSTNSAAKLTGVSQASISLAINGKTKENRACGFIFKRAVQEDSNE